MHPIANDQYPPHTSYTEWTLAGHTQQKPFLNSVQGSNSSVQILYKRI